MGHPNAPFGSYDVGDRIWVTGFMPWVNGAGQDVHQQHKILAIQVNEEEGTAELTLYAEGAFNYDPIYYQGTKGSHVAVPAFAPNLGIKSAVSALIGLL
jgi:hypothetical protein